jgi:hypothetical protein
VETFFGNVLLNLQLADYFALLLAMSSRAGGGGGGGRLMLTVLKRLTP